MIKGLAALLAVAFIIASVSATNENEYASVGKKSNRANLLSKSVNARMLAGKGNEGSMINPTNSQGQQFVPISRSAPAKMGSPLADNQMLNSQQQMLTKVDPSQMQQFQQLLQQQQQFMPTQNQMLGQQTNQITPSKSGQNLNQQQQQIIPSVLPTQQQGQMLNQQQQQAFPTQQQQQMLNQQQQQAFPTRQQNLNQQQQQLLPTQQQQQGQMLNQQQQQVLPTQQQQQMLNQQQQQILPTQQQQQMFNQQQQQLLPTRQQNLNQQQQQLLPTQQQGQMLNQQQQQILPTQQQQQMLNQQQQQLLPTRQQNLNQQQQQLLPTQQQGQMVNQQLVQLLPPQQQQGQNINQKFNQMMPNNQQQQQMFQQSPMFSMGNGRSIDTLCMNAQPGDLIAHPQNLNQFVICYGFGEFTVMECPEHLFYNAHVQRCDTHLEKPLGCASNPCLNGGKCTELPFFDLKCECPVGFSGANCERVDSCASRPCGPEGVCIPLSSGSPVPHVCSCGGGKSIGTSCQTAEPNPCFTPNSNLKLFSVNFNPSLITICEGTRPHFQFCQQPLIFSAAKQACDWPLMN